MAIKGKGHQVQGTFVLVSEMCSWLRDIWALLPATAERRLDLDAESCGPQTEHGDRLAHSTPPVGGLQNGDRC